jgi:hypothetical protein
LLPVTLDGYSIRSTRPAAVPVRLVSNPWGAGANVGETADCANTATAHITAPPTTDNAVPAVLACLLAMSHLLTEASLIPTRTDVMIGRRAYYAQYIAQILTPPGHHRRISRAMMRRSGPMP